MKKSPQKAKHNEEAKTAASSHISLGLPSAWKAIEKDYTLIERVGAGSFG